MTSPQETPSHHQAALAALADVLRTVKREHESLHRNGASPAAGCDEAMVDAELLYSRGVRVGESLLAERVGQPVESFGRKARREVERLIAARGYSEDAARDIRDTLECALAAERAVASSAREALSGPWQVERDTRYFGDRTATIFRVHWSSRVKLETEDVQEAIAVRDALNRLAATRPASEE